MNRRKFITLSATAAALAPAGCQLGKHTPSDFEIVDCHTHFYDPTRPEGVPWPPPESPLHRPVYPADYLDESKPHPVSGTVVVEASPWIEDNQWVLDLAEDTPFLMGLCGNLDPTHPDFPARLKRFSGNPLFRGIRMGVGVLANHLSDQQFLNHLRLLADYDLQLDVNGPPDSLPAVTQLAQAVPQLRIVIDHLANIAIDGRTMDSTWSQNMSDAARNNRVYAKISGLVEAGARAQRPASIETDYYASHLEFLLSHFGEDRLIYGSNWPVCSLFAPLHDVQRMVFEFFSSKGRQVTAKVFASNASVVYKYPHR